MDVINLLVVERHDQIVKLLTENGSVRVTDLSKMFNLTEETIRRDLEKLEHSGKLMRSHGGAVPLQEEKGDLPYLEREMMNVKEKMKIAKMALPFINEGDTILLDTSSTSGFLAKQLPNIPLTVITNSIRIVIDLAQKKNIHVICAGGNLSSKSLSFLGPLTIQSLDNYHADKAFISCKALDVSWGLSDSNDMQAMVKKKMLETADVNYLLVDYSKIGKKATSFVADFTNVHYLITDESTNESYLKELGAENIEIIN